ISWLISIRRWRAQQNEGLLYGEFVMAVVVEGGRIPPRWAERKNSQPVVSIEAYGTKPLKIGFVNNMLAPALEDTEMQLFELLDEASGRSPVNIKLYSLPGIPRGECGQAHLRSFYFDFADLRS